MKKKAEIWAQVSIVVHPFRKEKDENGRGKVNHYHWHVIKEWEYPKWIIDKHRWFFTFVMALVQTRFKAYSLSFRYCGFYPDTRESIISKRQRSISAAKAQVTKYENKMNILENLCKGTLFSDYKDHPLYPRLKFKIEENKLKFEQEIMSDVEERI
jgi:hypothetical protein